MTVLVTVTFDDRRLDLAVPAALPIRDLLPQLAAQFDCARHPLVLVRDPGEILGDHATLASSGVLHGARLGLSDPTSIDRPTPLLIDGMAARDRARRLVPPPLTRMQRFRLTLDAATGVSRPPGTGGPVSRMRAAWRWGDHIERLRWLVRQPRLASSVVIGVVGHRSDEICEGLADVLVTAREGMGVVVVDTDLRHSRLSRASPPWGAGLGRVESAFRRRRLGAAERASMLGVGAGGHALVSIDPTSEGPDPDTVRRLLAALRMQADIAVVDCGDVDGNSMTSVSGCDQVVVSAAGATPPRFTGAQTTRLEWHRPDTDREGDFAAMSPTIDPAVTWHELAVVLAAGWHPLDLATPMPVV